MKMSQIAAGLLAGMLAAGSVNAALTISSEPGNTPVNIAPDNGQIPVLKKESEPLRLKIILTDGSKILGIPSLKVLPVKTSFADMEIPVERIRSATFSADHAEIRIVLSNGDRVTAALNMAELQLVTVFGKAKIEMRYVDSISVFPGGSASWPRDGLWGYWPLDGDAKDASGNGHDGEIKGTKFIEGVIDKACFLDGNATIELGNPDLLKEEYTVAGWIRADSPARAEDWRKWIDKLDSSGGSFSVGIGDGRTDGGENGPHFIVWNGGASPVNIYPGKTNLRDGSWHHCAVTYKKGVQKVLVDGKLSGEASYSGPLPVNSVPIAIGGHNFGSYHHKWIGGVDDVFIYQRALSNDEIQMIYRCVPRDK